VQAGVIDGELGGGASLVKSGTGTVLVNVAASYTGGTTVSAGTLALGVNNVLWSVGGVTIDGASAVLSLGVTEQSVGALTLVSGSLTGGVLTGSGYVVESGYVSTLLAGEGVGLEKRGAGLVRLAAQNSYTGGTTLNVGTLSLEVSNALATSGNVTVSGGLLALGATEQSVAVLRVSGGSLSGGALTGTAYAVEAGTISTVLGGTALLTKDTGATVLLNAANRYTGGTVVNAGTLLLGAAERLAVTGALTLNGGVFDLGGFAQTTGEVVLAAGTIKSGVLTGGSYLVQSGVVDAELAGAAGLFKSSEGTVSLRQSNSYTGGTFVEAGRLELAGNNLLSVAHGVTLSGGILDLGGATTGVSTLELLGGTLEAGTLNASNSLALSRGMISAKLTGSASLTKGTEGTVWVSGASSYTGGTTVSAGTLGLIGTNVLAAGGFLELAGGVLDLGGVLQTAGTVRVSGGAVRNGTLSSTAGFTLESGSVSALLSAGAVVKQGGGRLTLGMADALVSTTGLGVNEGELNLGGLDVRTPSLELAGGTITNGTLRSEVDVLLLSGSILADVAGGGGLVKQGVGTVSLAGRNRYAGDTILNGGSLVLGADDVFTSAGRFLQSAGVLDLGGFATGSGSYTLTGGLVRNGTLRAADFTLASGTVDAVLGGDGRVTKSTDGMVLLGGEILALGDLTVNGGTLLLGASNRIGDSVRLVLEQGGTVNLGGFFERIRVLQLRGGSLVSGTLEADAYEASSGVLGSGLGGTSGLNKVSDGTAGGGLVLLTALNSYSGGTTVSAGTLRLGGDNLLNAAGSLLINGGSFDLGGFSQTVSIGTLQSGVIDGGTLFATDSFRLGSGLVSAVLGGTATLVKSGSGTVTLDRANLYVGETRISEGTLRLSVAGAVGSGNALVVSAGSLLLGGVEQVAGSVTLEGGYIGEGTLRSTALNLEAGRVDAQLSGSARLVKSTAATVVLGAANSYTGGTWLRAGTLELQVGGALGDGHPLEVDGGVLALGTTTQAVGMLTLRGGEILGGTLEGTQFAVESGRIASVLSGTASLVKSTGGTVVLGGQNRYSGDTTVNGGVLVLGGNDVLFASGSLTINAGTLDLGGAYQNSVSRLQLNGGEIVGGVGAGATIIAGSFLVAAGTIRAVLAGAGALTKEGSGSVFLEGLNTYTGATTVNDGRLVLAGNQVLAEGSALTVNGGTLDLGGAFRNKVSSMTLNAGAILQGTLEAGSFVLSSGDINAVLTGTGGLTKMSEGSASLAGANSYAGETQVLGGRLTLGGQQVLSAAAALTVRDATLDLGGNFTNKVALFTLDSGTLSNGTLEADAMVVTAGVVSTVLGGTGALTKQGTGELVFQRAATYTGGTALDAGVLRLAGNDLLSETGTLAIRSGGTLDLGGFGSRAGAFVLDGGLVRNGSLSAASFDLLSGTVDGALAGTGAVSKNSAGTVLLSGLMVGSGSLQLNAGTLRLGASDRLVDSLYLAIEAGATFDLGGFSERVGGLLIRGGSLVSGTLTASQYQIAWGVLGTGLAGDGGLAKVGDGSLGGGVALLTGLNVYTGTTAITAGTLQLGGDNRIAEASLLEVQGGTLDLGGFVQRTNNGVLAGGRIANGTLSVQQGLQLQSGLIDAVISGAGALIKNTDGLVVLTQENHFSGGTKLTAGTLQLQAVGALGEGNVLRIEGGSLALGGFVQSAGAVTLTGGVVTDGTLSGTGFNLSAGTVLAVLAGTGTLVKENAGAVLLQAANQYTGGTRVEDGTLALGVDGALTLNSELMVNGGKLSLGATTQTLGVVTLNGGEILGGTLVAGAYAVRSGTVSAVLAGGGALTKSGAGTVLLEGQNVYTGVTTVNDGRLVLGGNQVLSATAALTVNGGALDLGGQYTNNVESLTLLNGSIERGTIGAGSFSVANGLISANLTGTGDLIKTSAGTVTLSGQNSYAGRTEVLGGRLVLGGNQVLSRTADVVVSGGALDLGGDFTNQVGMLTLDGGALERGSLIAASTVVRSGVLAAVVAGTGTLTKETGGEALFQSASSYTGGTFLNAGTLRLGASERLADAGSFTISGGEFNLGGFLETVGEVSLLGGEMRNGTLVGSAFAVRSGSLNASLAGAGAALVKTGTGTVVIGVAASYTGGTTVEEGVLELGLGNALAQAGALHVAGGELALGTTAQTVGTFLLGGGRVTGGTLTGSVYSVESGTIGSVLAGTATLTKQGDGLATLTGANVYQGRTQVLAGTLRLAGAGVQTVSSASVQVSGGRLELAAGRQINPDAALLVDGGTFTFGEGVSGQTQQFLTIRVDSGSLVTGANTLVGTGSTLTLRGGSTLVSAGGRVEDGHIVLIGGTNVVAAGGSLVLLGNPNTGVASGLELIGRADAAPLLTLEGGANPARFSIGADVTVSGSGAAVLNSTGTGTAAGQLVLGGGARTVTVGSAGSSAALVLQNVLVTGTSLVKQGGGTLSLAGATMEAALSLAEGRLALNAGATVTGSLSFAGGTLRYAGATADVSGAVAPLAAGQVARVEVAAGTLATFGSGLTGAGTLVKTGQGVLALSGNSSFGGGTQVQEGSLALAVDNALLSTGSVSVVAGAALQLGTTAQNVGRVTLAGGEISGGTLLAAGSIFATSGTLAGQLAGKGSLIKTGDGTLVVSALNENFTGVTEIQGGTLQLGNGGSQLATLGSLLDTTKPGAIINNGVLAFKFAPGTKDVTITNLLTGSGSVMYLAADGFEDAGYGVKFKGKNESTGGTTLGKGVSLDLESEADLGRPGSKLTLNGGTVSLGAGGAAAITIGADRVLELGKAGAAFSIGLGSSLTINGTLTGTGSLASTGSGMMVLNNPGNSYTGGTFVKAGTVQLGANGSLGAPGSVVKLGAGGRLLLKRRAALSSSNQVRAISLDVVPPQRIALEPISQNLDGDGLVEVAPEVETSPGMLGAGTEIFTGDNSRFSGMISVSLGTLQIGIEGGTAGTLGTGTLSNSAVVRVVRGGSFALETVVSGTGKLSLDGSSALRSGVAPLNVTLTAVSDFTGATELVHGTLKLGAGASISKSEVLSLGDGAELDVTAHLGGYSIAAGQVLTGSGGRVRGNLAVSGRMAPGNSPGSMTVGGILVADGADYVAQFQKMADGQWAHDQIIVDGSLGGVGVFSLSGGTISGGSFVAGAIRVGTVVANPLTRVEASGSYRIISGTNGGTVSGAFKDVTGEFFRDWVDENITLRSELQSRAPLAFGGTLRPSGPTAVLVPSLRYTSDAVMLDIERKAFRGFGLGINAQEIGGYLDSFVAAPGDLLALEVQLESYKNAAEVTRALAGAGISAYADLMNISRRRMLDMSYSVGSRLDLLGLAGARNGGVETMVGTGETGWSVWQTTAASWLNRKADLSIGFGGYTANGQSSLLGLERPFGEGRIGLLGAAGTTTSQFSNPATRIVSDAWHLGAYASLPVAPFFADIAFIFGNVENDARRSIEFPGYAANALAKFNTTERVLRLGGGLQVMPAQSSWEMSLTEHILHVSGAQAALGERGGDVLSARIKKAGKSGLLNEVGMTVGRRWVVRGLPVAVRLQGNWLHDFDHSGAVQASFVGAPASAGWFSARTAGGDRNALRVNGSVEIGLTESLSLRIGGDYERRRSGNRTSLTISLGIEF
jgi:autotransporter-associated beta strand protein